MTLTISTTQVHQIHVLLHDAFEAAIKAYNDATVVAVADRSGTKRYLAVASERAQTIITLCKALQTLNFPVYENEQIGKDLEDIGKAARALERITEQRRTLKALSDED